MQPNKETNTDQGFVDEPLPDMPGKGEDAGQEPARETTPGTDEGSPDREAPVADEPTA